MARKKAKKVRDIPYDWEEITVEDIPNLIDLLGMHGLEIYGRWTADHREFTRSMPGVRHVFNGYCRPVRRRYVQILK